MSLKQRLGFDVDPLYLMDGTAFLFRGFFANAACPVPTGWPRARCILWAGCCSNCSGKERPSYFAFILDGPGKHFRHELLPTYKANRPAPPEGLIAQIEPMKRMVASFGLRCIVSEGCEADDCIASLGRTRPGRKARGDHRYGQGFASVSCAERGALGSCLPRGKTDHAGFLPGTDGTGTFPVAGRQALIGDSSDNVRACAVSGKRRGKTVPRFSFSGVSARSYGRGAVLRP